MSLKYDHVHGHGSQLSNSAYFYPQPQPRRWCSRSIESSSWEGFQSHLAHQLYGRGRRIDHLEHLLSSPPEGVPAGTDTSTIPIELVLFCLPPLPLAQARPSEQHFSAGRTRWPLKWFSLFGFCPQFIHSSHSCQSSFTKQSKRADSM